MRLQSRWEKHLSQVWLGFVLWILLIATLVEAGNQTSAEPDAGELHLSDKESIPHGQVLLGTIIARLIFFLVNRALHYVDRQYNRQLRPFHWQVINRLRLSQGWIRRMNQEDAELIKNFIDGVPIEGRLPTAAPTSPRLLRFANLLETLQIPYQLRMIFLRRLRGLGIFRPREPAYHALETSTTVVDLETSFHSLNTLTQHRDWHMTPQANQLVAIIVNVLRERVCGATLRRFADIIGLPWRLSGSGFDLARLEPPQKYDLHHWIVRSLRAHQSRSTSLRVTFRTSTVEDRLRRYYETIHLMRGSDPFALPGQRASFYWQPLELLTYARKEAGIGAVVTHDHQRPGGLEEQWLPIDLEGLMADGQTRVILKGEVGAGKTTWCRRLAKIWSASDEESPSWLNNYHCVLLISLRDWSSHIAEVESQSTGSRRERLHYWLAEGVWYYSLDTADAIGYRPPLREVLFVLDGYDEVAETAASRDSLLGDVLHHLLQARGAYAAPNVIITTRPQVDLAHHRDFVDQARVCRIKGLSREHQADFIRQFFGEHYFPETSESSPLLLSQAFLDTLGQHGTLKQLQHNPLLLKMMCWLYFDQAHRQAHLPTLFDTSSARVTPFYEKTISALKRRRSILSSDVPNCDRLLKRLAHQREALITSSRVAEVFSALEIHDQTEQQRLLNVLSVDLGLLHPLRPNTDPLNCHWEFLHKSFQEYYRALALIDELLSDAVSSDTVFNELRLLAQEDGQLGYFLVGLLLTHPDKCAAAAAQSLINRAIDSCKDSSFLIVWTWRLLGEVSSSQRSRIKLPGLEVLVRLGWLPRAIEATGSIELCDWLMDQVSDADKRTWLQWGNLLGTTALRRAASCGYRFICQWLLEQVKEEDRLEWIQPTRFMEWTALHEAANSGHESVCRLLVEQVPRDRRLSWVKASDSYGRTALHLAAEKGHELVSRLLVEQVPEEDRLAWMKQADFVGRTALHSAAEKGHESVCRFLVEQVPGEDRLMWMQQADLIERTALHLAAEGGHENLCRWLVEQLPVEDRLAWIQQTNKEGVTALYLAASKGHESVCRCLVEQLPEENRLASIQQATKQGFTALHIAAESGYVSVCRWLVEQVPEEKRLAWIQLPGHEGSTVLKLAAQNGHESTCRWLVEQVPEEGRLAWIQKTSDQGVTALHQAASKGHESVCCWLVEQLPEEDRLAWIQKADGPGMTALHRAALEGRQAVCRWLVERVPEEDRSVWIQKACKEGWTALHLAASNGHVSVCRWLVEQVPGEGRLAWILRATESGGDTALHRAAFGGHQRVCRWLMEQMPEKDWLGLIQTVNDMGSTVLLMAAVKGHESLCRWLVEQAPVKDRLGLIQKVNNKGWTALHMAALRGLESLCRWLVEQLPEEDRLAWIRKVDYEGLTALHRAAQGGHESVCRWLVERLPEVDRLCFIRQADWTGRTALDYLSDEKAERLLSLVPAFPGPSGALVPAPPSRPPRVQQTRGRLVGDATEHGRGPVLEGDIVGLEESKGDGPEV